ncbi:cell pole-organizing protein PopZ [Afipia massiliensis]|uniref:Cell pole-organizing protein PopZ n=1 Tax=Afipia massiliensis TaxID=211460 RepID=A0A840MY54_9BRAD|nr:hypothetical protein [Afipia massiliensis]MBB5051117.1 cell pole-organizing protein PopZ [Afipia massiliensis]
MPTLDIGGRQVEIDDGFLKLSPAEQNATVEEIAKSIGAQPAAAAPAAAAPAPMAEKAAPPTPDVTPADAESRVLGLMKAGGTGVAKGAIGLAGLVPMLSDLAHTGANKFLFDPLFNAISGPRKDAPMPADINKLASPDSIEHGIEKVTGEFYKPKNTAEEYAQTIGSFLPNAVGGPGTVGTRLITQAMLPGAASEAAGQATKGTMFETPARIGAAILSPVATTAAARGFDAVRNVADGMSRRASNHMVKAMEADTPAAVRAEVDRLGPDAMLADAGPAFLGKAQGASLNSDQGRSVMQTALTQRDRGTNSRIMGDVDRALGPAEDPLTVTNAIKARRSEVDGVAYPQALDNAPAVRTAPILAQLDDMIPQSVGLEQRALQTLRDMMTRYERRPRVDAEGFPQYDGRGNQLWDDVPVSQNNASVLHKVKQELDNVIEYDAPGLGVPASAFRTQQASLKELRFRLNEALERQVPGYAEANRASSSLARRADAVDLGTKYLGDGKTTASPGRFLDEFEQLEAGERIAFAKGSRGDIERKLGTKANDLQALRGELQGEGGWNTAKIATVHGDDAAAELMRTVERNLKFRDTHHKVVENSQTAQRLSAAAAMKPSTLNENSIVTPAGNWLGMALTAAKRGGIKAVNALTERAQNQARVDVARILTAQGPERDRHIQAIIDALDRRQASAAKHSAASAGQKALAAALMAQIGR